MHQFLVAEGVATNGNLGVTNLERTFQLRGHQLDCVAIGGLLYQLLGLLSLHLVLVVLLDLRELHEGRVRL